MSAAAVAILVEDEPQIRRFVRTALESENWRVLEAGTLKRGLSETAARRPDLVVLDRALPDGDGIGYGKASTPCSPDTSERLGRKLSEHRREQSSQWTTIGRIGSRSSERAGRTFTSPRAP
jgi:DNA-binding NtrC family response regulator